MYFRGVQCGQCNRAGGAFVANDIEKNKATSADRCPWVNRSCSTNSDMLGVFFQSIKIAAISESKIIRLKIFLIALPQRLTGDVIGEGGEFFR